MRLFGFIRKHKDSFLFTYGLLVLGSSFTITSQSNTVLEILVSIAGFLGLCFITKGAILLFLQRIKFDQLLVSGNFLTKVTLLVLFLPFTLTLISSFIVSSPQDLIFDSGEGFKVLPANMFWGTYIHFIDPGNQDMTIGNGRMWSACLAIFGMVLLNGLLVSSLISYFDKRTELWLKGGVRYNFFLHLRPHYVVIGGNDMAAGIVKQLLKDKGNTGNNDFTVTTFKGWIRNYLDVLQPYILIQTSRDVESFRRELFSTLSEEEEKRIIIYYGNRTSPDDIKDLKLESAKEVYILGEEMCADDIESYHDTMNMECLELLLKSFKGSERGKTITGLLAQVQAYKRAIESTEDKEEKRRLIERKRDIEDIADGLRLRSRIMFEYQTTFSVFQFYDIDENVDSYISFKPFNYYEMWAQRVLINKDIDEEDIKKNALAGAILPLEGAKGINKDDDSYVHLIIAGMSRMGIALGIEAAHLAHYPNYTTKNIRTRITFIDKNAEEEKEFFMGRFKGLFALSHWRYGYIDEQEGLVWRNPHRPTGFEHLGGDFLDIEWEFIKGGIEASTIQDYILQCATPQARVTIAICLPESNRSHAAAMYMPRGIYESSSVQQILVYNRYGNAITDAIARNGSIHPYCGKLKGFGHASGCFIEHNLKESERIGEMIDNAYNCIGTGCEIQAEMDCTTDAICTSNRLVKAFKTFYKILCNTNSGNIVPDYVEADGTKEKKISYKGKSKVANNWSSIYNGNMLWTKLRSVNYNGKELCEDDIQVLADVEHNRWNVEELLMNFMPLTKEEQEKAIQDSSCKNKLKGEMRHLDICSNEKLMEIDGGTRIYDVELTRYLQQIYNNLNKRDNSTTAI